MAKEEGKKMTPFEFNQMYIEGMFEEYEETV
jgi:hypothetical protein